MVRAHRNEAKIAGGRTTPRRSFFDRVRGRSGNADLECDGSSGAAVEDAATAGVVADLVDGSFYAALDQTVTVVDFWAPWCGPCKELHPLFDAHAVEHSDGAVRFGRVNVDESPSVAAAFKVMSIPTIIVFDAHGHEIEREIGVPGKRRLDQLMRSAESLTGTTIGQGAA